MTSKRKIHPAASLIGGLALSTPSLTGAAEWIVAPSLTLELDYSDNALLAHTNKENELITVVRPGVSIFSEGARARVDINYAPQYRDFHEDTEDDEVIHFLRADANVELLAQHLFLDGWASADITNVDSTGSTGIGGLTGRSSDTEVYTSGFSPYARTRLGNFALLEARYTLDSVNYDTEGLLDSVGQRADLVLGSGPAFNNQVWEITATYNQTDYEDQEEDNKVSQFRAELAQQLSQQWALAFAAGYEEYELVLNPDIDDSIWSVGVIYSPNVRTRFALGGGERAFGKDYYLDFSHQSRRTVWTASYTRDYTSAREELLRPNLFQRQDAFGNLVRDPVLENPPAVVRGTGGPAISAEFYQLEDFSTNFVIETGRTTVRLGGGQVKRLYTDPVDNTRETYASSGIYRNISVRTTVYLDLFGTDHKEEALKYTQWLTGIGGSYQLGENTSLGMRLAHLTRDAEEEVLSYDENNFRISLTVMF